MGMSNNIISQKKNLIKNKMDLILMKLLKMLESKNKQKQIFT